MALTTKAIGHFFAVPLGSEASLSLLQRLPLPERKLLLAARGLSEATGMHMPGDLGVGAASSLDAVFRKRLKRPDTDWPWLVRSSACLFGVLLSVQTRGAWEAPAGTPVFVSFVGPRGARLAISPLRFAMDQALDGTPRFSQTLGAIRGYRNKMRRLPETLFRLDLTAVPAPYLEPFFMAQSFVAVCGQFEGKWDLDFSPASLRAAFDVLEEAHRERRNLVQLGLQSIARDHEPRRLWLEAAASAYLGEVLRGFFGGAWQQGARPPGVLVLAPGRTLDPTEWIRATQKHRRAEVIMDLVERLEICRQGRGPWPTPPS